MYASMISGKAPHLNIGMRMMPMASRMYRAIFIPSHLKFLNFREIMDILVTKRMEKIMARDQTIQKLLRKTRLSAAMGIKPRNMALAGVGSPKKVVA